MLALSPIPMFDRMDHPSVPTTFPWRKAAGGGQGWPKATPWAVRPTAPKRPTSRIPYTASISLPAGGNLCRSSTAADQTDWRER
jgi:hypothetical protein